MSNFLVLKTLHAGSGIHSIYVRQALGLPIKKFEKFHLSADLLVKLILARKGDKGEFQYKVNSKTFFEFLDYPF